MRSRILNAVATESAALASDARDAAVLTYRSIVPRLLAWAGFSVLLSIPFFALAYISEQMDNRPLYYLSRLLGASELVIVAAPSMALSAALMLTRARCLPAIVPAGLALAVALGIALTVAGAEMKHERRLIAQDNMCAANPDAWSCRRAR